MRKSALLALFFLAIPASSLAGGPGARLFWDSCDSYTYGKQFTGPGTYRQVVIGGGFESPIRGHMIRLRATAGSVYGNFGVPLPEAWRFDPAGCQAGRLDLGGEPQPCPYLGTGAARWSVEAEYDGLDLHIIMSFSYELTVPDPGVTYVLGELAYDHSRSAAGPQDPAVACGEAERDVCFVIEDAQWCDAEGNFHPINFEFFYGPWWQGGSCFADLPVEPATWGSIKAIYR